MYTLSPTCTLWCYVYTDVNCTLWCYMYTVMLRVHFGLSIYCITIVVARMLCRLCVHCGVMCHCDVNCTLWPKCTMLCCLRSTMLCHTMFTLWPSCTVCCWVYSMLSSVHYAV